MSKAPKTHTLEAGSLSCSNCTVGNCSRSGDSSPGFCLTRNAEEKTIQKVTERYIKNSKDRKIALVSAEVEADYYRRATRVEEILIFIKKMGYKKVGLATCRGLLSECNKFAKVAKAKGIDIYGVACKVGAVDKTVIGLREDQKINPGSNEPMCNPILQAELLNEQKTDFNIILGLCVGHDSLFIKYSKAPVSYLIVKDRVLCHNPAAGLYCMEGYYKRFLGPDLPEPR